MDLWFNIFKENNYVCFKGYIYWLLFILVLSTILAGSTGDAQPRNALHLSTLQSFT